MPPKTRTGFRKLLRQVNGLPHATDEDHEEHSDMLIDTKAVPACVDYDPLSSSDEEHPPLPAKNAISSPPRKAIDPSRTDPRRARPRTSIKAPPKGSFKSARADKARRDGVTENTTQENKRATPQFSNVKRKLEQDDENDDIFDGFLNPLRKQGKNITFGSTSNIHGTRPIGMRATATKEYRTKPIPAEKGETKRGAKAVSRDAIDEDVSDFSVEERKPSPQRHDKAGTGSKKGLKQKSPPSKPVPINLLETLGDNSKDPPTISSQVSAEQKTSLSNVGQHDSGANTPLSSRLSANEGESLHTLEQYFADLPPGASDDRCPLCEGPVHQEHYWEFWKGKEMTVRHQTMFCSEHKKREAIAEYTKQGFPSILWDALPQRVEHHHDKLLAILKDEKPSEYRAQHAERVAAGEDRSVRTLLHRPEADMNSNTGYYGSRGLRAMMEAISTQMQDELRARNEIDSVVSFGGFATFILKVLVPELTISLVMEDLECSEQAAQQYISESANLGLVVHEEVEDRVEAEEQDQDYEDRSDGQ